MDGNPIDRDRLSQDEQMQPRMLSQHEFEAMMEEFDAAGDWMRDQLRDKRQKKCQALSSAPTSDKDAE
ncbi:hypothetical protein [Pseudomonas syringae]|nr:hypothetical protein [Pseudomonas syringae]